MLKAVGLELTEINELAVLTSDKMKLLSSTVEKDFLNKLYVKLFLFLEDMCQK
ncbi:hypothetical protein [Haploplasma axanthum]|uniref:Uncharacterized protein n=1 Tax=Haploplasma axanthum TaxID=29552 RepID=A0A449BBU1_HAPAX|nr:hypothetical protein [Haploplasma axanthum]VEU79913.1 Uncharacterised protein [Haploplasma axanthum]